jgi:hypothetical protein
MSSVSYLQLQSVKNFASPEVRSYESVYMLNPCPIPDVIQPHVFMPINTYVQENIMTANRTALIKKNKTT